MKFCSIMNNPVLREFNWNSHCAIQSDIHSNTWNYLQYYHLGYKQQFLEWHITIKAITLHKDIETEDSNLNFISVRRYACAVLAMGLCLSVTSRSSTKTAKHRIT